MADQTPQNESPAPGTPPVAAPDKATEVPAPFEPEVTVDDTPVAAQVTGPEPKPVTTAVVHETHVVTDKVVTDASSPDAVIVPEAGRGNALTPIAQAYENPKTPEQVFADAAKKS